VVPMVTPVTASGKLDAAAVDRVVEALIVGGVSGVFVLGTTGEGAHVPESFRLGLVERAARQARGRCLIYAGLGDARVSGFGAANEYLRAGAGAIVAHPPISAPVPAPELDGWYRTLLDQVEGPLVLYNIPSTTKVSIPLDVVEKLLGHPRLAGIKDSENNPARHEELLRRFGGRPDFSVFVGVGALMEKGLKLGADGIVPSVGNLIPDVCRQLCDAAQNKDWAGAEKLAARMAAVCVLYQKGRTLNESLAVLKAAMSCRGLCTPNVLPPLRPVSESELGKIRGQMAELHLLNGKS